MVGRELGGGFSANPRRDPDRDGAAASSRRRAWAAAAALHPVDLRIRAGEVLGLGGLLGSGRTELARLLFGLDRADSGEIRIDGVEVDASASGRCDRARHRVVPGRPQDRGHRRELSVRENIVLALQARGGCWRALRARQQASWRTSWLHVLGIKVADIDTPVGALSGGNQQKVVLARWLATAPRLLILDEPTRGIDMAAPTGDHDRDPAARASRAWPCCSSPPSWMS